MDKKKLFLALGVIALIIVLGISGALLYNAFKEEPMAQATEPTETTGTTEPTEFTPQTYEEQLAAMRQELEDIKTLNGGTLPMIALDSQSGDPNFILGTYTDQKVSNAADAQKTLLKVKNIMGIQNTATEYKAAATVTFDGTTQYRLQQMHDGYPVYGQQLVVTADANGNTTSLSGNYASVGIFFDDSVNITESEAQAKAMEAGFTCTNVQPAELVAYTLNGYNEMAYIVITDFYRIIVSAKTGDILVEDYRIDTALPENISTSNSGTITSTIGRDDNNANGNKNTYNTAYYDYSDSSKTDTYIFYDSQRNIVYHDLAHQNLTPENMVKLNPLQDEDNIWTTEGAKKAIALYKNLSYVYDFYLNKLGLLSFDGNGAQILAFINDGALSGTNAYNHGPKINRNLGGTPISGNSTILAFGGVANYHVNLDTVGHEFTHAVQRGLISGLINHNETGALMEGYADIMGELIESANSGRNPDWIHGERNMINPSSVKDSYNNRKYPQKYKGAGYDNKGESHHNSTIISHLAYEIYNSGLQDVAVMAELLYRSWGYLTADASFYDYRMAMLAAARVMNLGDEKIEWISQAFDNADITVEQLPKDYEKGWFKSVSIRWTIQDATTLTAIPGAEIILFTSENKIAAKVYTDQNGVASFDTKPGQYNAVISVTGYQTYNFNQTFVRKESVEATYLLQNQDYQTEQLKCSLAGVITDALNGQPVEGVNMYFRKGYNVTQGRTNPVLTTNSLGEFRTEDLEYGTYTVELNKEGYIISYVVVQAAASNWENSEREDALNQNYSISPQLEMDDTMRIVLTWGSDPDDLDSHLTGPLSNGENFHVYYSSDDAYDNNECVVLLDVDDTTSYGPETITINTILDRDLYHYYVHDYTNRGNAQCREMAASGATVQVFSGSRLIATYKVPTTGVGTVWHVFDYDPVEGKLIPVNTFKDESGIQ